jgi:hypothetical protein
MNRNELRRVTWRRPGTSRCPPGLSCTLEIALSDVCYWHLADMLFGGLYEADIERHGGESPLLTLSGHCPKPFGGEFLQDSEPRASSHAGPVLAAKSFLGKRRAARSGQDRRLLQFSRGVPPPCPLGMSKAWIKAPLWAGSIGVTVLS